MPVEPEPSHTPEEVEEPSPSSPIDDDEKRKSTLSSSSSLSSSTDSISESPQLAAIRTHNDRDNSNEKHLTPNISRADGGEIKNVMTGASLQTTASSNPAFEVDFEDDDRTNPRNWGWGKKSYAMFTMSYSTLVVVLYSTSYTSGIPGMMKTFGIANETLLVLGITTYLLGLALGSVILAPLSEMYGRRPIYLICVFMFMILILPCALAKDLATMLSVRFFGAFAASAMISNAPGTVNDIVTDEYRALAFSIWSIGPMNGPVVGPLVGGFVYQYCGWRWTNYVVMIAAGVSFVLVYFVPETYAPSLLRQRAAKIRKETDDNRWWSRYDEKKELWPLLKVNLSRPFILTVTEPICIFWDLYIAVVYGLLYLCFVAYPTVFTDIRGWSPGFTGLAYIGIGVGGLITIVTEPLLRRMINSHKVDPATGKVPPEAMVSVVCIAAVLMPAGEFIFAWTATPTSIHWIAPIIAGVPFGAGNAATFIYASNYLVHSYGIYAASALAGNAVFRSIMGATLPLAGPSMYATLGPNWAGTVLGLLEVALIPIPVVFWKYGARIRKKSALIRSMREDQERAEAKKAKANERKRRMTAREETEERIEKTLSNSAGYGAGAMALEKETSKEEV